MPRIEADLVESDVHMAIRNTDWIAIEQGGRWEIRCGDRLHDYADNDAQAKAKLLDNAEPDWLAAQSERR